MPAQAMLYPVTACGRTYYLSYKDWRAILVALNSVARCRLCSAHFTPDLERVSATLCVACFIHEQRTYGLHLQYLHMVTGEIETHLFRDVTSGDIYKATYANDDLYRERKQTHAA